MLENICNNTFLNTFDTSEWFLVMGAIIGQFQHYANNDLCIGSRIMRNTKQLPRNPFLVLFLRFEVKANSMNWMHYYINSVGTSSYKHFVKYVNWYKIHIQI